MNNYRNEFHCTTKCGTRVSEVPASLRFLSKSNDVYRNICILSITQRIDGESMSVVSIAAGYTLRVYFDDKSRRSSRRRENRISP